MLIPKFRLGSPAEKILVVSDWMVADVELVRCHSGLCTELPGRWKMHEGTLMLPCFLMS